MIALAQRDLPLHRADRRLRSCRRTARQARGVSASCPEPNGDVTCDQVGYPTFLAMAPASAAAAGPLTYPPMPNARTTQPSPPTPPPPSLSSSRSRTRPPPPHNPPPPPPPPPRSPTPHRPGLGSSDPALRGLAAAVPGRPASDAGGGLRPVVRGGGERRRANGPTGGPAHADAARPVLRDHASSMDVLTEDFVTVKRRPGCRGSGRAQDAVPNALLPLVTLAALQFGDRRRGDHDRDDLLLARPASSPTTPSTTRVPGAAGHVPGLLGRGDLRQPGRHVPTPCSSRGCRAHERDPPDAAGDEARVFGVSLLGLFAFLTLFGAALAPYDPLDLEQRGARADRRRPSCSAPPRRARTCSRSAGRSGRASRCVVGSRQRSSRRCWARQSGSDRRLLRRLDRPVFDSSRTGSGIRRCR